MEADQGQTQKEILSLVFLLTLFLITWVSIQYANITFITDWWNMNLDCPLKLLALSKLRPLQPPPLLRIVQTYSIGWGFLAFLNYYCNFGCLLGSWISKLSQINMLKYFFVKTKQKDLNVNFGIKIGVKSIFLPQEKHNITTFQPHNISPQIKLPFV